MTAAIYGQRAGKQTVIIEGSTFGGQITSSPNVENYPGIASVSGSEFSMNLLDQATKLGAETVMEQVTGIEPALPAWEAGALPLNYVRMKLAF